MSGFEGRTRLQEFQPALLVLEESSAPPLGRVVLWALLVLLACLLAGAVAMRVDIVAVAPGKLVPSTYLKVVQPAEPGVVRDILVSEGDSVRAGQVLMRMDSRIANAEHGALLAEKEAREWQLRRLDAQLSGRGFEPVPRAAGEVGRNALQQYRSAVEAHRAGLEQARLQADQARLELAAAEEVWRKLQQLLPLQQEREVALDRMAERGYVSRVQQADQRQVRIGMQQDLRAQEHAMRSARSRVTEATQRVKEVEAHYRRELQAEREGVVIQIARLEEQLSGMRTRQEGLELTAPQDGVVKSLFTHTPGSVVQAGAVLVTLVPAHEPTVAEVWMTNEDAGFARVGQSVSLKVAAFPFQRYGLVAGTVEEIAADAEAGGNPSSSTLEGVAGALVYRCRVRLKEQVLVRGGLEHHLLPGMRVVAEVRLGQRRVIDYLLSPVVGVVREAGRER